MEPRRDLPGGTLKPSSLTVRRKMGCTGESECDSTGEVVWALSLTRCKGSVDRNAIAASNCTIVHLLHLSALAFLNYSEGALTPSQI